jgi:hypothetical protein
MQSFMKYFIFFILIITAFNHCNVSSYNKKLDKQEIVDDTLSTAVFFTYSDKITVAKPIGKFIINELKFYNTGKKILKIEKVNGSCFCASSTILNSKVQPGDSGKIMLYVNLDGFKDDSHIVEYYIFSNSINSPYTIKLDVVDSVKNSGR